MTKNPTKELGASGPCYKCGAKMFCGEGFEKKPTWQNAEGKSHYDKDGNLKAPDVYNIMGGSEWNNNGKNIIVVDKESKESINYDIYFRKIKPRIVGGQGVCTLQYDISKQKFYELEHYERKYAFEGDGVKREVPNIHFQDNEKLTDNDLGI